MSLIIFSNSEYNFLWPLIEETIGKINKINKIFVCDINDLEKPKGFDKYIIYDINNCYSKRWTNDILPNIETDYILVVHDVQVIVNYDENFILNSLQIMKEYSIDRLSLNVFNGIDIIKNYNLNICNLNSANGNTFIPYDVCPCIWNTKSFKILFETFPNETYKTSELNDDLQYFCKNNFKCYGQNKSEEKIFYCIGRPYLEYFKILFITINKEIMHPLDVYMDMKNDFIYFSDKYKLYEIIKVNHNYDFILYNLNKI